jgi:hypothetical protein
MADPRRAFGPVVLTGLGSAGLAAVAGNRAWVVWTAEGNDTTSMLRITGDDSATVPLGGALALVLLACWGVVLVTRGRVRRLVAVLALLAAAGMLLTAVVGVRSAADGLRDDVARLGVDTLSTHVGAWFWVYLVCSAIALAAAAAAVRWLPSWPEMGVRYDAPGAGPATAETDLDLWRALDEGRDPTLPERRPVDP